MVQTSALYVGKREKRAGGARTVLAPHFSQNSFQTPISRD
jgi:hypothetical protein